MFPYILSCNPYDNLPKYAGVPWCADEEPIFKLAKAASPSLPAFGARALNPG